MPFESPQDRGKLEDTRREIDILRETVSDLERRLEKQAVLLRALFALLGERPGFTEAELIERFRQVETYKACAPAIKCPSCGRAVNLRHHRCLYCGEACPVESAFEYLEMGAWPTMPTPRTERPGDEHGITTRPGG
jgi:ribosomal protein L32